MGASQQQRRKMALYHQYEVIGRRLPTELDPNPKAYRIKLFTKNKTQAKSRFWYFIRRLVKMKKANAQILSIREIFEKKPDKVKKFGIWLRYDSRSGTTNMYKEYSSTHIIKVAQIQAKDCLRKNIKQYLNSKIHFPLAHRVLKAPKKAFPREPSPTAP